MPSSRDSAGSYGENERRRRHPATGGATASLAMALTGKEPGQGTRDTATDGGEKTPLVEGSGRSKRLETTWKARWERGGRISALGVHQWQQAP